MGLPDTDQQAGDGERAGQCSRGQKALEVCPNLTLKLPIQTWYSYWVVLFHVS